MNRVAKNAVWIIACKIAQSLITLVIGMLTARYLGPSNYGLITYASSLTAFVLPIMQLGMTNILVRELVDHPAREGETLGTALLLNAVSSLFCMLAVSLFAFAMNPGEPVTVAVCVLYSLTLFFQAFELFGYWYQAKLLSKYYSLISLGAYFVISAYKVFLLVTRKSVFWFALTNALDFFVISLLAYLVYRRLGGQPIRFSAEHGKQMFDKSKYYIVSSMMVTIFAQTDKIMLKQMLDDAATGYYGAAVTCATISSFVFSAIIDSFRPSIFEVKRSDSALFERRIEMLYCIIIYLSLAQSLGMTLLARLVIRILYGAAYAPAASALRIVVWYTTFSYLGAVRNIWILANDQQKHLWKINLSGALANVFLNALLIPVIGVNGAALASLLTQFFTNVVTGFLLKPIRDNNRLMLLGCNPKFLKEAFFSLIHRKEIST